MEYVWWAFGQKLASFEEFGQSNLCPVIVDYCWLGLALIPFEYGIQCQTKRTKENIRFSFPGQISFRNLFYFIIHSCLLWMLHSRMYSNWIEPIYLYFEVRTKIIFFKILFSNILLAFFLEVGFFLKSWLAWMDEIIIYLFLQPKHSRGKRRRNQIF